MVYIYSGASEENNSGFIGKYGDGGENTTGAEIDPKYYNAYKNYNESYLDDGSLSCDDGICFGHALSETSGWYDDYYYMVHFNLPWFVNGGLLNQNEIAGIFYKYPDKGDSMGDITTRTVFIQK